MTPPPIPRQDIRKVFVRAPNWLGDVIMATPAFARIRSFFAPAEIVCGIKKVHASVLAGSKSFDRYLFLEKARGWRQTLAQARRLRAEGFDAVVLFPNSFSSAFVCVLAGIPIRIGYVRGRRPLISHGVLQASDKRRFWQRRGPRRKPVPMVDYWFAMLDAVGMPRVGPHPILLIRPEEEAAAARAFAALGIGADDRVVLFGPTASFGPSKLWTNDRWAELARRLVALRSEIRVLVQCGPGEEETARRIVALADSASVRATIPPIPLDAMKPFTRRAALFVTTDSGPRHLAVAFDVPHVVLMGPTHPDYTSRVVEFATVLRHDVDCGPCHLPICPEDHRCMTQISVDEVFAASRAWLE